MINEKDIEKINSFLEDEFERGLFHAAITGLYSKYHPLTFNNFAYAMRELIRHLLHRCAPDEEVKKCCWFKPDNTSKTGITRTHRLKYMMHGGFGDFLVKQLNLQEDIDNACNNLTSKQKILDSFTHVGPKTFAIPSNESKLLVHECITAVIEIISIIEQMKKSVFEKVETELDRHLLESTIFDFCEEIQILAVRAYIEQLEVEEISEMMILHDKVVFNVAGTANCCFEYGSNKEWREGDGTTLTPSFPFHTQATAIIKQPFGKHFSIQKVNVDVNDWYE